MRPGSPTYDNSPNPDSYPDTHTDTHSNTHANAHPDTDSYAYTDTCAFV
jgi:hypothetical protein